MVEQLNSAGAARDHVAALDRQASPRSSFDRALLAYLALQPRSGASGLRDGRRAAMVAALDARATWLQIREWRRGNARAPLWALDLLDKKMAERQNELAHGREFTKACA